MIVFRMMNNFLMNKVNFWMKESCVPRQAWYFSAHVLHTFVNSFRKINTCIVAKSSKMFFVNTRRLFSLKLMDLFENICLHLYLRVWFRVAQYKQWYTYKCCRRPRRRRLVWTSRTKVLKSRNCSYAIIILNRGANNVRSNQITLIYKLKKKNTNNN